MINPKNQSGSRRQCGWIVCILLGWACGFATPRVLGQEVEKPRVPFAFLEENDFIVDAVVVNRKPAPPTATNWIFGLRAEKVRHGKPEFKGMMFELWAGTGNNNGDLISPAFTIGEHVVLFAVPHDEVGLVPVGVGAAGRLFPLRDADAPANDIKQNAIDGIVELMGLKPDKRMDWVKARCTDKNPELRRSAIELLIQEANATKPHVGFEDKVYSETLAFIKGLLQEEALSCADKMWIDGFLSDAIFEWRKNQERLDFFSGMARRKLDAESVEALANQFARGDAAFSQTITLILLRNKKLDEAARAKALGIINGFPLNNMFGEDFPFVFNLLTDEAADIRAAAAGALTTMPGLGDEQIAQLLPLLLSTNDEKVCDAINVTIEKHALEKPRK